MTTLNNGILAVKITPKGAELQELAHLATGINFIWNGDPAFWGKHSPVLFPVVGTLRNDTYTFGGKDYSLGRHGFARDMVFEEESGSPHSASFRLSQQAGTLEKFPFYFDLFIHYTLEGASLSVTYEVKNTGEGPMFFSVGGHPAFAVPFLPGTTYTDYSLVFEKAVTASRWPITPEGLISTQPVPLLENTAILPLDKSLFAKDALVFKHFPVDSAVLSAGVPGPALRVSWPGFPYLGIWAAKGADFVCIEPWCGIADPENASGDLTQKEGIETLEAGHVFTRSWQVSVLNG